MARRIPSEFEAFYREAKDPCFRALLATVGSAAEADDVLAESFTRALARWDDVRHHARPEAWVVRTALNLHRDRWRRSQRQQRLLQRREAISHEEVVDPVLLAAVRALPERQREAVALRVLLGLSAEQAGEVLGVDPGTVGTHLRRGLAALRTVLHGPVEPSNNETTQEVLQ